MVSHNSSALKLVKAFNDGELVRAEIAENDRVSILDFSLQELERFGPLPDFSLPNEEYDALLKDIVNKAIQDLSPDIKGLPYISDANPATRQLFKEIYHLEFVTLFIGNDDHPSWNRLHISKEEFERQVDEDIRRFHLERFVEKDGVAFLYCCSGDFSQAFSVDPEHKELSLSEPSPVSLTDKQYKALHDLSNVLWDMVTLCEDEVSGYKFNNDVLAGKLGSLWPMSIDEMACEIDCFLGSCIVENRDKLKKKVEFLEKKQSKGKGSR